MKGEAQPSLFAAEPCHENLSVRDRDPIYLILTAPITTAADDIYKYFFIVFQGKIRFDISCESSARQRSHTKHQALFP